MIALSKIEYSDREQRYDHFIDLLHDFLPDYSGEVVDLGELERFGVTAETAYGFHSIWITDGTVSDSIRIDGEFGAVDNATYAIELQAVLVEVEQEGGMLTAWNLAHIYVANEYDPVKLTSTLENFMRNYNSHDFISFIAHKTGEELPYDIPSVLPKTHEEFTAVYALVENKSYLVSTDKHTTEYDSFYPKT